jgi:chorismate mutase/prephenate dehydrogenase
VTSKEMGALRSEIEKIDSDILELIARRAEVSREIGLTKAKDGLETRDRSREKAVIAQFAKRAKLLGVGTRLANDVAKLLISDSVSIQEAGVERPLVGKTALVVGGAGRMGEWFCRFLSNRGAEVAIWDPRGRLRGYESLKTMEWAAASSDIVVIASPLGVASSELEIVLDSSPAGLVFDLCSVKSHIAAQLREAAAGGFLISSIHPMFGPKACSPKGKNVIVCDCGSKEANDRVSQIFSSAGSHVSFTSLDTHDELMAYVLGLSHLCSLVFAGTIRASGKDIAQLRNVQGPSFKRMSSMALELSNESKRVYHDIQALNPNTRKVVSSMEQVLRELEKASLDADPARFAEIMRSNGEYLEVE